MGGNPFPDSPINQSPIKWKSLYECNIIINLSMQKYLWIKKIIKIWYRKSYEYY